MSKQAMMSAGCPPEMMAAVEAAGLNWVQVWAMVQKLTALNVPWDKVWEIVQDALALFKSAPPDSPIHA